MRPPSLDVMLCRPPSRDRLFADQRLGINLFAGSTRRCNAFSMPRENAGKSMQDGEESFG
jgi:hypothetical protein